LDVNPIVQIVFDWYDCILWGSVETDLIVISSWIQILLSSLDWCILEDKMLLSTLIALEIMV